MSVDINENIPKISIDFSKEKPDILKALDRLSANSSQLPGLKENQIQEGLCAQKDLDQFSLLFDKTPDNLVSFQNIIFQGCLNNPKAAKILGI